MNRHLIYLLPCLFFSLLSLEIMSQSIDSNISQESIEINMSAEIQDLLEQSLEMNKRKGGINGFCVQIYNGQSRPEAQRAKYRFMKMFPEVAS